MTLSLLNLKWYFFSVLSEGTKGAEGPLEWYITMYKVTGAFRPLGHTAGGSTVLPTWEKHGPPTDTMQNTFHMWLDFFVP